jgi:hypothetical protein
MRNRVGAAILIAMLAFGVACAHADVVLGPGNITPDNNDNNYNSVTIQLSNAAALGAGTYTATEFNYQFTNGADGGSSGTVTPLLLVGSGGTYTPVAIGSAVTYSVPTAFVSTAFGPSDTFTLAAAATVYGGLYWDNSGGDSQMPIGYDDTQGSVFQYSSGSIFFFLYGGPNPPVVGTPVSLGTFGGAEGSFQRAYDFSIDIPGATAIAVPLPASAIGGGVLIALAGILRLCSARRRLQKP